MKHQISYLSQSKIELEIILEPQEMEIFWHQGRKNLSLDKDVILTPELEKRLYDEVATLAVRKSLAEILEKEEIEAIGQPEVIIKKFVPQNEFIFQIKTAILPHFQLPDYKAIAREVLKNKRPIKVEEKEVERAFNWLIEARAKFEEVERKAQKGDLVELEIICFLDNQKIDDLSREEKFILGSESFLPGFDAQIEGMKKGEGKEFFLVIPSNYWLEKFQGKKLFFKVFLKNLKEKKLPDVNDEWAKSIGHFNSLADLKNSIREGLYYEKELKERDRLRILLLEKLSESTKIDLPEILIEAERNHLLNSLKEINQEGGISFEEFLRKIQKSEEEINELLTKEAIKTLKSALILREIAKKENCEPDLQEVEEEMTRILNYHQLEGKKESIDKATLFAYTKEKLTNEKVFQFLENL